MANPSCRFTGPQRYASDGSGNGEKKCRCGIWSLPLPCIPVPLSPDSSPFLLLHPFRWIVSGHFELRSRSLFSDNQITKFCNDQGCCLGRVILVTYYVAAFTCPMIHIGPSTHWLWFFLGKEVISPFMPTEQVPVWHTVQYHLTSNPGIGVGTFAWMSATLGERVNWFYLRSFDQLSSSSKLAHSITVSENESKRLFCIVL